MNYLLLIYEDERALQNRDQRPGTPFPRETPP